ncbi:hypothetical protein N665_0104s0331 [Sinapis alba]|nr:hypothetical protein N665_0104s0331 [Sinapis alba]
MLLIDENSTLMQGSVSANRSLRFRHRFSEGSVYKLRVSMLRAATPIGFVCFWKISSDIQKLPVEVGFSRITPIQI